MGEGILALAAIMSFGQPAERVEVPVAELRVSDVGFTCGENGLPTVRIEHRGEDGIVHFAQHGRENPARFHLENAVKSVVFERRGSERRWTIHAEGQARAEEGIAAGAPATIDLVIAAAADGSLSGDFAVRAGGFSRTGRACRQMPPGARPLRKSE